MAIKSLLEKFRKGLSKTAALFNVRSWFGRKVAASFKRCITKVDYIPPWAISAIRSSKANTSSRLPKQRLKVSTPKGAVPIVMKVVQSFS